MEVLRAKKDAADALAAESAIAAKMKAARAHAEAETEFVMLLQARMRAEHRDELARCEQKPRPRFANTMSSAAKRTRRRRVRTRNRLQHSEQTWSALKEGRVAEEVRRTRKRLEQLLAAVERTSAVAAGLESTHVIGGGDTLEGGDDGQEQDKPSPPATAADVRASGTERAASLLSELEARADADAEAIAAAVARLGGALHALDAARESVRGQNARERERSAPSRHALMSSA